jgi:hypothetical protein
VIFFRSTGPLIQEADQSLIDYRFPHHLNARLFADPGNDCNRVTAAAFDQICNSITPELAQRRVRREGASAARPFGIPVHLVARVGGMR